MFFENVKMQNVCLSVCVCVCVCAIHLKISGPWKWRWPFLVYLFILFYLQCEFWTYDVRSPHVPTGFVITLTLNMMH